MKKNLSLDLSYLRTIVFLLLIALLCDRSITSLEAQSIGNINSKSINIDDLTDEQIFEYIRVAEERGLTQPQLEALARQRGISQSDITKFRRRIQTLQRSSQGDGETQISGGRNRTMSISDEGDDFGGIDNVKPELTDLEKTIFGMDVFQNPRHTFSPNLNIPTPVDYQLGPGDELWVDLWGATQQSMSYEVSAEGMIRPENLGPIYVNGLSIEKAADLIIDRLSQAYSGLKGSGTTPPTIFNQVSLGRIRTIRVEVIGEVRASGIYALPSLATVYTALYAAGGPTAQGTFRDIRLVRDNKVLEKIDLYSFLTEGIRSNDRRLKDGDIILVRGYKSRIELHGEVRRPGLYELKDSESFSKVLGFAGGFKMGAFKPMITIKRSGATEMEIIDLKREDFDFFNPIDGDRIEIGKILLRFSNRVIVNGAVYRPGEYELTEGLSVKGLIEKGQGLRGDAFLTRATVYRTNSDFSQTIIPIDLEALLNGTISDIELSREDVLNISSVYDLNEEQYVKISGEVSVAGVYPFFSQMTVQDLIVLSGGLKESASGNLIEIARRNNNGSVISSAEILTFSIDEGLSLKDEDRNTLLQPFDQVYIRKSPGYSQQEQIKIEGEVLAPGFYTISRKDERISDFITRAKGLTPYAFAKGASLIRKTSFVSERSANQVSEQYLEALRSRILANGTEKEGFSESFLLERLKRIQSTNDENPEYDESGSRLKRSLLIEDGEESDSLGVNFDIAEEELVALDLDLILQNPGSKYDFTIKPGDVISIPGKLETVRVAGEVTSPLNVRYDENFSFKDYIHQSGGFRQQAAKGHSFVQYPNGERKGVRRFLFFKKYPKVEPGSTIFVSRKMSKKGVSLNEIIGITSSVVSLAFLAIQLNL